MQQRTEQELRELLAQLSTREKASLCSGDGYWHTDRLARVGLGAMMMTDGPHGIRKEASADELLPDSEKSTCFPTAAALACSFDRELVGEIGRAIGREAIAQGVQMVLGPGVNIKRSPLCGRNFEYFSEDPVCAGELAAAMIGGIQSTGTGACVKHFCANSQEDMRFLADSRVDRRALHEIYLEAFRRAVEEAQPRAVMSSYNKTNGTYSGESDYLVRDVLRGRFGFRGLVMSDWGAVNDRVQGVRAGMDLEMPGKDSGNTQVLLDALKSGALREEELDACALRVLRLVDESLGGEKDPVPADLPAHSLLARRAAAECAVLMKNEGSLLPFSADGPLAVIGAFAKEARYQGAGSSRIRPTEVVEALDALRDAGADVLWAPGCGADGSATPAQIDEAVAAAKKAGRAALFLGLPDSCESEGYDREHMELPQGMLALADAVLAACPDTAVVLMLGSPVTLPFERRAKAILCLYTGGQCAGGAAADLLLGRACPSGKLAESWPLRYADVPCHNFYGGSHGGGLACEYRESIYVGYRYYEAAGVRPLFKFGHGLSYTSFRVEEAACTGDTLTDNGALTFSWTLRNTGARAGAGTVFVFVSRAGEPLKQLRAFAKAHLAPGASARQSAALTMRDLSYFDRTADAWRTEAGEYTVYIGQSLDDVAAVFPVHAAPRTSCTPPPLYSAAAAKNATHEMFAPLLGEMPQGETPAGYTMNSTLNELRGTAAGRTIFRMYARVLEKNGKRGDPASVERALASFGDMPLRAVCALSRGSLPKNLAQAILCFANHRPLKGIAYALKKNS